MTKCDELAPRSIVLEHATGPRRDPARPEHLRDSTYADKYDDQTVFYDLIRSGSEVIGIGPPLLNLESLVMESKVSLEGQSPSSTTTKSLERGQLTRWQFEAGIADSATFALELPRGAGKYRLEPSEESHELFKNKRVLVTVQKNEEIEWILDWATYYSRVHDCDAILIYDNGSSKYELTDLEEKLKTIDGIEVAVVVDWPFKYGPQGGLWVGNDAKWDSDFCQIGALQDARYRFLDLCQGFLSVDVDELVVSRGESTLFHLLEESEDGVLGFEGHWIANAPVQLSSGELPRHQHFFQIQGLGKSCSTKWAGTPSRWPEKAHPTAHYVRNARTDQSPDLYLAHFQGVNSAWKNSARTIAVENKSGLHVDGDLLRCLEKAFPETVSFEESISKAENEEIDLRLFHFQRWLDREIFLATCENIEWKKRWTWNGSTLVFEAMTKLGMIAFDIHITESGIRLAVNARQADKVTPLGIILNEAGSASLPIKEKINGFWVLDPISDAQAYVSTKARNLVRDLLIKTIRRLVTAVENSDSQTTLGATGILARSVTKSPLRNLRDDAKFNELADRVRAFAGGARILYVPN